MKKYIHFHADSHYQQAPGSKARIIFGLKNIELHKEISARIEVF
jgi:hypothetical protein